MVWFREAIVLVGVMGLAAQASAAEVSRSAIEKPNWPKPQDDVASSCPEQGPGYVRVVGSSTCVKMSGRVRIEGGAVRR